MERYCLEDLLTQARGREGIWGGERDPGSVGQPGGWRASPTRDGARHRAMRRDAQHDGTPQAATMRHGTAQDDGTVQFARRW